MDKNKEELIKEYEEELNKLKRILSFSNLILNFTKINKLNGIGNTNIDFIKNVLLDDESITGSDDTYKIFKTIENKIRLEIDDLKEKIENLKSNENINSLELYVSKLSEDEKDYINKLLLENK